MIDPNGDPTPPPAPSFTDTHPPAPWAHPSRPTAAARSSATHAPSSSRQAPSRSSRLPSSSGRRWGCPCQRAFTEYYHGPPPPPPPPPPSDDNDDDVHPPPSAPPSDDVHTEHSDAALAALHASRPPLPRRRVRATPSRHRAPAARLRRLLRLRPRARARVPRPRRARRLCAVLDPRRKRGPPKGSIDAIEAWLRQTEALVGILLAAAGDAGACWGLWVRTPSSRAILVRIDHGAYAQQQRLSAQHPATHPCLCHPSIKGWISGVHRTSSSFFFELLDSRSVLPPSLLSSCCAEVACRGGTDGAVARRRGRDGGIAVACSRCDPRKARTLPPHRSSRHRRIRRLRALRVMGARAPEPRALRMRSRSRGAHPSSRAAEPVLAPALLCAYAYPWCLFPYFLRIMRLLLSLLSFLLLLHPRDALHSAHPRTSYIRMYMYHIYVHAHAQCTHTLPLSFRARVRVPSECKSSRARREDEGVLARRRVLGE
ncbi:hypothetical protein DFH09DRAFT_1409218 [Mycena vulgaris]|nr:hypothetical protein DFH09DRAFT_1409218 [Mycena vulgaris]